MEGKTHRIGGTVGALAGYLVLQKSGNLQSAEIVNPALQLIIIYSSGIYGGVWNDNDHHWQSSPLNDPISRVQNIVLHLANEPFKNLDKTLSAKQKRTSFKYKLLDFLKCTHRSWQTHSEVTLLALWGLWVSAYTLGVTTTVDLVLWWLMLVGFAWGVFSHLLLDMLTTEGIRFACGVFSNIFFGTRLPETIRLVPKSNAFKTGSAWEMMVRRLLAFVQYVLTGIVLLDLIHIDIISYITKFFS